MQPDIEAIYPLSPLQEGMWFQSRWAPGHDPYVRQLSCDLHGPLDVPAFRRSWEAILARHPALRIAVAATGAGIPFQMVHRQAELPWAELDGRAIPPTERDSHLAELRLAD